MLPYFVRSGIIPLSESETAIVMAIDMTNSNPRHHIKGSLHQLHRQHVASKKTIQQEAQGFGVEHVDLLFNLRIWIVIPRSRR